MRRAGRGSPASDQPKAARGALGAQPGRARRVVLWVAVCVLVGAGLYGGGVCVCETELWARMTSSDGSIVGRRAPFGAVLGYGPGKVPAHSSDYKSCSAIWQILLSGLSHKGGGGLYYGMKWQCVEFARRWLIEVMGVTFGDIDYAYQIFDLEEGERLSDGAKVTLLKVPNGSNKAPPKGAMLIWDRGGYYEHTGHVAIITDATESYVRVAEQNIDDRYWPTDHDYARELPVTIDASGGYNISALCAGSKEQGTVLGWIIVLDQKSV